MNPATGTGRGSSLAAETARIVRQWIQRGELVPEELYSVNIVAERLGISRSPAREALLVLAEAGLVEFVRNRGFRVLVPGVRDIVEIAHLRLALEPVAAAAAARGPEAARAVLPGRLHSMQRAALAADEVAFGEHDRGLHDLIMGLAGNARAARIVAGLRETQQLIGISTAGSSRTLFDIYHEHVPVVERICAGDAPGAHRTMTGHLEHTGSLLMRQASAEGDSTGVNAWRDLIGDVPSELPAQLSVGGEEAGDLPCGVDC